MILSHILNVSLMKRQCWFKKKCLSITSNFYSTRQSASESFQQDSICCRIYSFTNCRENITHSLGAWAFGCQFLRIKIRYLIFYWYCLWHKSYPQSRKDKSGISLHPLVDIIFTILIAWNYPPSLVKMGPVLMSSSQWSSFQIARVQFISPYAAFPWGS